MFASVVFSSFFSAVFSFLNVIYRNFKLYRIICLRYFRDFFLRLGFNHIYHVLFGLIYHNLNLILRKAFFGITLRKFSAG